MHNIVLNKYVLKSQNNHSEMTDLNVIYGSDENYQFGAGISAVSLLTNNPQVFFRFHFFLDKVSPRFLDKLRLITEQFPAEIHLYELDNKQLKMLPASDVWSSAMYFRLIALDYLSVDYDYALYLDADVVCNGAFELEASLIDGKVCGVIADDISVRMKSGERLNTPELINTYFNSGVMFVNLKAWHNEQITDKCFELLSLANAKELYKYPDQDVLNLILRDKLVLLNKRLNTIYTLKNELSDSSHQKYTNTITTDTALIHYTGVTKPWHTWANYPASQPFYRALEQSPWTIADLKPATKFVERKKEYKHLFKQGHWAAGSLSGIRYLAEKFNGKKR
ncbi:MAG: glycosyltransferase [Providencia heimbachae]|nr:glycosyltransferase [Providencia heimbachae]